MRLILWLSLLSSYAAPVAAFCRAGTETEPLGACTEQKSVPQLRWERGCVEYTLGRRLFDRFTGLSEDEVRADLEVAFGAWSETDCGRVPFEVRQAEGASATERHGFSWDVENESLILGYTATEWRGLDFDANAAAVTLMFFDPDTGEIYDADIVLNTGAGAFTRCVDTCIAGEIDLLNTITHEAGHYLGLGHSTVPGATMAPYGDKVETEKRSLEADDREGYCALDLPEPDADDEACTPPVFHEFEPAASPRAESSCNAARIAGRSPWELAMFAAAVYALRRARTRHTRT